MSDLIRKNQSLIEWKEDFKDFVEGLDILRDDYKGIMAYIDELPSAEPRKKGKWIQPCDITGFGRCSNCNALWDNSLIENRYFKHCPRCGADMREGEEDG